MSNIQESSVQGSALTERDSSAKTHAFISYIMMLVGLFTGIFWIIVQFGQWLKNPMLREQHLKITTKTSQKPSGWVCFLQLSA